MVFNSPEREFCGFSFKLEIFMMISLIPKANILRIVVKLSVFSVDIVNTFHCVCAGKCRLNILFLIQLS